MKLEEFLRQTHYPLIVVGTLPKSAQQAALDFILKLGLPVYLEAVSGLREEPRLAHLKVSYTYAVWKEAASAGYPIDGILRLGGIPTFRPWRDLEDKQDKIAVCSISHLPFTGLSGGDLYYGRLEELLPSLALEQKRSSYACEEWLMCDKACKQLLYDLFAEEPSAESSLVHFLSKIILPNSLIYLGNSLPIREWDLAAVRENKKWEVFASRGINGIDGQISTFLGLCNPGQENWGIVGDLTALYDLVGPWILKQLSDIKVNLVIINNRGGQIFSRMFPQHEQFLNKHSLDFEPLAKFWGMEYERWSIVPQATSSTKNSKLIEIVPDLVATERFWSKYEKVFQKVRSSFVAV
jgi:2-succinyl-5-enolpyruvyl-6-hydroxy-3-cyclohexene-1-carboxylate synthase